MKTVKMTKTDKANNLLAGKTYELPDKEAALYVEKEEAVIIKPPAEKTKKAVKHGDG